MTTTLDLDPVKEAALVASQNDAFRRSILGNILVTDAPQGQFVMTRGVAALGPDAQLALTRSVASFDAFNADSDPQGWHEMGVIDLDGTKVWFKIDLYDVDPSEVSQLRLFIDKLRARREQLRRQQEDIQETLSELDRLEQQSSALLAEREPPMAKAAG